MLKIIGILVLDYSPECKLMVKENLGCKKAEWAKKPMFDRIFFWH